MLGIGSIKRSLGGVFYGWWIVAASFVTFLVCGGSIYYGFTAFFNPIADEFNWTAAQISLAFSLRSVESGVLAPLIGFLTDKLGARKIVVFGMALSGAGLVMMSFTNSLLFFYGSFFLLALGTSCGLGNGQYVAVANWFRKKRTWAIGVMSAGFAVSGVTGPVLVWLIGQEGWRNALVIIGIVTLAVGVPLGLVVRHRPEPYGYLPDGASPDPVSDPPNAAGTAQQGAASDDSADLTARQAVVTRAFWMLIIFGALTAFVQAAITVHEMPYLTSEGFSREVAGWVILGITSSSLIGRLGFGWVGDRYDKRYLLAFGAILQFIGIMIFTWANSPWMLIVFVLFYGPGYASQIPLWPALRADLFGLKHFATIGGVMSLSWTIAGITAPVLAGWVFDTWGTYRPIWLAYGIATAAGIPFLFLMKLKKPSVLRARQYET